MCNPQHCIYHAKVKWHVAKYGYFGYLTHPKCTHTAVKTHTMNTHLEQIHSFDQLDYLHLCCIGWLSDHAPPKPC